MAAVSILRSAGLCSRNSPGRHEAARVGNTRRTQLTPSSSFPQALLSIVSSGDEGFAVLRRAVPYPGRSNSHSAEIKCYSCAWEELRSAPSAEVEEPDADPRVSGQGLHVSDGTSLSQGGTDAGRSGFRQNCGRVYGKFLGFRVRFCRGSRIAWPMPRLPCLP